VDGAGGGAGMNPWRMMNEWGVPGIELWSLTHQYCERLAKKGEYIPDTVLAVGVTLEDQMFKGLALASPYVKAIGMARSPLAAVMVAKTIGNTINDGCNQALEYSPVPLILPGLQESGKRSNF